MTLADTCVPRYPLPKDEGRKGIAVREERNREMCSPKESVEKEVRCQDS